METPSNDSVFMSTASSQYGGESNEYFQLFKNYILQNHMSDIVRILLEDEVNIHHCLKVDGADLLEKCVNLTELLFFQPERMLKLFDRGLHAATCYVFGEHHLKSHMVVKPYLHVRFNKLPTCSEIWRDRVPKSIDIGRFLAMECTVIRTSSAKILEYKKEYMCSKCKNVFSLQADFSLHYSVPTPTSCPVNSECPGKKFVAMMGHDGSTGPKKCKDYQEIRIQEQVRKLSMGTIPRSMTIILEDDLVDSCKPGDDIVIFGFVACRWHPSVAGKPCELELVLKANNIEVCNERHSSAKGTDFNQLQDEFECFWASHDELSMMKARNYILASLCPQVYGLYVVKLAVALVLAGGVPRTDASGSRVRGECHLLLVGDPGTGKSQFLKYAAKVTPRSVLTTGIGSSTAGLTVSAIRDGPHWTLEAGALVLADGGVCCIDEFSGIKEQDRSAIHEAMEQQTISVAKAGLVCKLNTRTSILAATNPKLGKYDDMSSVSLNIGMASPLLSRFDLVLVLLDEKNLHWDSVVADYLLMGKNAAEQEHVIKTDLWGLEQMQAYFGIICQIHPSLSSEADQVLRAYYRCHRQSNSRNAARTTIRLLESLIRLSEAHARLMFRNVVTIQDAIAAVTVVESSMQGGSLLPTGSILHSCFPKDADVEYRKHARLVLQCLNLENLMQGNILQETSTQQVQVASNTKIKASQLDKHLSQVINSSFSQKHPPSQKCNSDSAFQFSPDELGNLFHTPPNRSTPLNQNSSISSTVNDKTVLLSKKTLGQSNVSNPNQNAVKESHANKENFSKIFYLGTQDNDAAFGLDFAIDEPAVKKCKTIDCDPDFDFNINDTLSQNTRLSAKLSVTEQQPLKCEPSCSRQVKETLIPSQLSLFSVGALNSPESKSQLHSCFDIKRHEMASAITDNNENRTQVNSCFTNLSKENQESSFFHLPENQANFIFSDAYESSLSLPECSESESKTASSKPRVSCNHSKKNNSFAFTLDPSMVEDMCSELDFL